MLQFIRILLKFCQHYSEMRVQLKYSLSYLENFRENVINIAKIEGQFDRIV